MKKKAQTSARRAEPVRKKSRYDITVSEFDADTIPVFCKKNRISVAFYYMLKAQHKNPREMHVGKRRLVSRVAAEEWRRACEAEGMVEVN